MKITTATTTKYQSKKITSQIINIQLPIETLKK